NFGTNGWNAYLKNALKDAKVTAPMPKQERLLPLVRSYLRMATCQVAYDGYGYQSEGDKFDIAKQEVLAVADTSREDKGQQSFTYTNATQNALCGRVVYPTGNDPTLKADMDSTDDMTKNTAQFKHDMEVAWMKL